MDSFINFLPEDRYTIKTENEDILNVHNLISGISNNDEIILLIKWRVKEINDFCNGIINF